MKTFGRKCSVLLTLAIILGLAQPGAAIPAAAAGNDFVITNGVLIKYSGSRNCVAIPAGVTAIGENAFRECTDMMEVAIPKSVTSIGRCAFSECSGLTAVTIPDSVTAIGNYAFDRCAGLKNITLSGSLKTIGIRAFNECTSLAKVAIPNSVVSIGNYAFEGCSKLKSVVAAGNVKTIGTGAFDDCGELTFSGYPNTAVQAYADKNGFSFKSLGYGSLTLDTKAYTLPPRRSYTIGACLSGSGLTMKNYSSKNTVARVSRVSSKEFKVTALKEGTSYIMFDVYKNGKKLTHASVKIIVKRGVTPHGSSEKQVAKF